MLGKLSSRRHPRSNRVTSIVYWTSRREPVVYQVKPIAILCDSRAFGPFGQRSQACPFTCKRSSAHTVGVQERTNASGQCGHIYGQKVNKLLSSGILLATAPTCGIVAEARTYAFTTFEPSCQKHLDCTLSRTGNLPIVCNCIG